MIAVQIGAVNETQGEWELMADQARSFQPVLHVSRTTIGEKVIPEDRRLQQNG